MGFTPLSEAEPWLDRHWRYVAAMVYLTICIFDFVVMPSLVYYRDSTRMEFIMSQMSSFTTINDQTYALNLINSISGNQWQTLTLMNGGLFHLSFGAILTGSVLMRNYERKNGNGNGNGITNNKGI